MSALIEFAVKMRKNCTDYRLKEVEFEINNLVIAPNDPLNEYLVDNITVVMQDRSQGYLNYLF